MGNPPSAQAPEPTHAGGIVYRITGGVPCYLLVSPRNGALEWVLPKGHIESGENPAQTAVREVREETGVLGRVVGLLGHTAFRKGTKDLVVVFYLLAWLSDGPAEEDRKTRWFRYADALVALTHADNRGMLECAEARRRAGPA